MSKHIYGIHDYHEWFYQVLRQHNVEGWCVYAEDIGHNKHDTSGKNFGKEGLTAIVRLSNAFGEGGGIPHPRDYDDFAQRCANFVAASQNIKYITLHNEPNIKEWDYNIEAGYITRQQIVEVYKKCYAKIKAVRPDILISPPALATWAINPEAGWNNWIHDYFLMLKEIGYDKVDWISLHAYATAAELENFTQIIPMNAPYQNHSHSFTVLWEYIHNIPQELRHLPIIITETNFNGEWRNNHTGRWIQTLYWHIDEWNKQPNNQKILGACVFRTAEHDTRWCMCDERTKNDFRESLKHNYTHNYTGEAPQIEIKPTPGPSQGRIVAEAGLNVRETPGGRILTVASYGDLVQIRGEKEGWLNVAYNGFVGWASAEYIER